jgi:hypothetical protein
MHGLPRPTCQEGRAVVAGAHRHRPGRTPEKAFIPDGSPYLGQTILGEPLG